jgi:hypothetical protein
MTSINLTRILGFAALLSSAAACGDALGPVDSIPMTLTINSMNSSDIDPVGVIEKDENIGTETGNPWGEFIRLAEDQCQTTPAGFDVLSVTIALDVAGSSDVATLDDVISGDAIVFFASTRGNDAAAVRVDVGSGAGLAGVGPVNLPVIASRTQLAALLERMVGGDFHVGLRAETDRVDTDSFSMDVRVTIQTRAMCE